jgi:hypothetical protein
MFIKSSRQRLRISTQLEFPQGIVSRAKATGSTFHGSRQTGQKEKAATNPWDPDFKCTFRFYLHFAARQKPGKSSFSQAVNKIK